MNRSESIANLAAALAKAQAEFPAIPRGKEVSVTSQRTGKSYKFRYAPFEDILRAARPTMVKYGLAFTQGMHDGLMETVVLHESGEWLSHDTPVVIQEAGAQAVGSAITYAKRYGFCSAFGIQADDDDDGNAADGNHISPVSTPITGAQICKDMFNELPQEGKDWVQTIAADAIVMLGRGDIEGAFLHIEAQKFDVGHKGALWSLLDSKQRSAIKKYSEQLKKAA